MVKLAVWGLLVAGLWLATGPSANSKLVFFTAIALTAGGLATALSLRNRVGPSWSDVFVVSIFPSLYFYALIFVPEKIFEIPAQIFWFLAVSIAAIEIGVGSRFVCEANSETVERFRRPTPRLQGLILIGCLAGIPIFLFLFGPTVPGVIAITTFFCWPWFLAGWNMSAPRKIPSQAAFASAEELQRAGIIDDR